MLPLFDARHISQPAICRCCLPHATADYASYATRHAATLRRFHDVTPYAADASATRVDDAVFVTILPRYAD